MSEVSSQKRQYMKYPWELWLDGEAHHLRSGVDFVTKPNILRNQIYGKFSKNPDKQVKVELTSEGDLVIQVIPRVRALKQATITSVQESEA